MNTIPEMHLAECATLYTQVLERHIAFHFVDKQTLLKINRQRETIALHNVCCSHDIFTLTSPQKGYIARLQDRSVLCTKLLISVSLPAVVNRKLKKYLHCLALSMQRTLFCIIIPQLGGCHTIMTISC